MKKPRKPAKPYAPKEPSRFVGATYFIEIHHSRFSPFDRNWLRQVLENYFGHYENSSDIIRHVEQNKTNIHFEFDGYNHPELHMEIQIPADTKLIKDPNYESKFKAYEKKLAQHPEKEKAYKEKFKVWKKENEVYAKLEAQRMRERAAKLLAEAEQLES